MFFTRSRRPQSAVAQPTAAHPTATDPTGAHPHGVQPVAAEPAELEPAGATQRPDSKGPSSWGLRSGQEIAPGVEAVRLLGGGASFEAWLAFDEYTFSPVVVKLVRPDLVGDESAMRGLNREIRALSVINHPVALRGLRHEVEGPRPHLVLEAIDGPRLSSLLRRYGPLSPEQYLPLAIDVASVLHYLGNVGWTHLDIKPSNIIMGAPARVIDLSVARPVEDAARLTVPIGTDAYMAPEQADPGRLGEPGPASDVWGLGATLFHAVAGVRPFPDGDPDAREAAVSHPQTVLSPRPLPEATPVAVAQLIGAMLDPDPTQRPTPSEVSRSLEPVLSAQPVGKLTFKVR